jgi:hypothetical protein
VLEGNTPVNVPVPLMIPNPTMRAEQPPSNGIRTANAAPVFSGPTYPRTDPRTFWYRPSAQPDLGTTSPAAPGGNSAGTAELGPMIDSPPTRSR